MMLSFLFRRSFCVDANKFVEKIQNKGINFFTGVPCSLLKGFCQSILSNPTCRTLIACNEGAAAAISIGHFLETGTPSCMFLQNSGLGHLANPFLSLAHSQIYKIPILLLVSHRGSPLDPRDEPQHLIQGIKTEEMIKSMDIPYLNLDADWNNQVDTALQAVIDEEKSFALLVRKNVFSTNSFQKPKSPFKLSREDAIALITEHLQPKDAVVSTTGKASRELFELRESTSKGHHNDFLTVGGMGHASSIAMGIALANRERRVVVLDGDGAFLMHMGTIASIGSENLSNLKHVVLNNGSHESVGGVATVANEIDIPKIATSCGYHFAESCSSLDEVNKHIKPFLEDMNGPALMEIKINLDSRKNLGRPTSTPFENRNSFMKFLQKSI